MSNRATLISEIEELQRQLENKRAQLANLPNTLGRLRQSDCEYGGSVLRLVVRFGKTDRAQQYSYAAIFANGQWHVTGSTTPFHDCDPMSWDELCEWIAGCHTAVVERMLPTDSREYLGAA